MIEAELESPVAKAGATAKANRTTKGYVSSTVNIQEKHSIYADDFQSLFVAFCLLKNFCKYCLAN